MKRGKNSCEPKSPGARPECAGVAVCGGGGWRPAGLAAQLHPRRARPGLPHPRRRAGLRLHLRRPHLRRLLRRRGAAVPGELATGLREISQCPLKNLSRHFAKWVTKHSGQNWDMSTKLKTEGLRYLKPLSLIKWTSIPILNLLAVFKWPFSIVP